MNVVVDASLVVDWVAPDTEPGHPALLLLDRLSDEASTLIAPRLLLEECANALLRGVRKGRWTGMDADHAYDVLCELPVAVVDVPQDRDRAWELSRRFDEHPIYDLVYVAVAERTGSELYTADRRLVSRVGRLEFVHLVS